MRRLALLILLFGTAMVMAGESYTIMVKAKIVDEERNPLTEAKVEVFEEGDLVEEDLSDSLGKSNIGNLEINKVYQVVFSKEGFQKKVATINSKTDYLFGMAPISAFVMEVTLLADNPEHDLSFLDTMPMIKFYFNWDGMQTWDMNYTKGMLKRVDLIRNGNPTSIVLNQFDLIAQAEEAFNNREIDSAIALYDSAYALIHTVDLIPRMEELKDEKRRWDWDYKDYVDAGDELFASGNDLFTAQFYYNQALNFKDHDYPREQLYKIDEMIYGSYDGDWDTRGYYRSLLAKGHEANENGNYEEALKWYKKAAEFHEEDPFPKEKIEEINNKRAKQ